MRHLLKRLVILSACFSLVFVLLYSVKNESETFTDDNSNCKTLRKPEDVTIDNVIWQVLETSDGRVNLLNAYLDERWNKTVVRINANGPNLNVSYYKIYCQFWFDHENKKPLIVQVSKFRSLWVGRLSSDLPTPRNKKISYFLMCPLESQTRLPTSVSLVSKPCDNAENNLEIINNKPTNGVKKEFGVCTKQMEYDNRDFVVRFIEWVEMLKILGVDKIHGYNRHVSKDLFKAMNYYEEKGFVEIKPFLEPYGTVYILQNWPMRTIERNLLNDCFYRNKNLYKYIAIIDPDEILMPLLHENWHDLLLNLKDTENQDYFYFSYVFFAHNSSVQKINEIPSHLYMLQHIQRSNTYNFREQAYHRYKSILNTANIVTVNHHIPTSCFSSNCQGFRIPANISYTSHYRNEVAEIFKGIVEDKTIWKFKDKLIESVEETLKDLKFVP